MVRSFPSFCQLRTFQAHQATHIIHQVSHADPKSRSRKTNAPQYLVAHPHLLRTKNMLDPTTYLRLFPIARLLLLRQRFVAITLLANLRLVATLRVEFFAEAVEQLVLEFEFLELLGEKPDGFGVWHSVVALVAQCRRR